MKLCSLAYLPPPTWGCAMAFHENLNRYAAVYDVVTYSECDWPDVTIKLPASPEQVKHAAVKQDLKSPHAKTNKFAVNNLVFFTGLRIAAKNGYTHVIYLEADCRIGTDHWDEIMFEEFFSMGRPLVAAGTLACYNPANHSGEATRRWEKLVSKNHRRNVPVATYGWLNASTPGPSLVFPNGALSILDISWMQRLFDLSKTADLAVNSAPWDMALGLKIWERFEVDAYEVTGYINCIFSGYGDILTSEAERIEMLRSGKCVAIHQCKSNIVI